jgi:hypothetical protein
MGIQGLTIVCGKECIRPSPQAGTVMETEVFEDRRTVL